MTQFVVFNSGTTLVEAPIENTATGDKDSVFLQPGGRATLPEGYSVQPTTLRKLPALRQTDRAAFLAEKNLLNARASYYSQAVSQKPAAVQHSNQSSNSSGSGKKQEQAESAPKNS